jgi:hypothetical protein
VIGLIDSATLIGLAGLCMTSASLVLVFLSLALGEQLREFRAVRRQILRNSPWTIFSLFLASFISIFGASPQLEDSRTSIFYLSVFLVFAAAPSIIYMVIYTLKVILEKEI